MLPPNDGAHRDKARRCLDTTAKELNAIPNGTVGTDVMMAHSAKAQVFASAAIAHALLDIGDALRAALRESTDG
ncbi:hypothetical protein AB0D91_05240 [Streptomyces canus]|uniref:hypothetical protein n=1 Tax=Streptomyces canus TaxID=58343 RepID=UPI0033D2D3AA